MSDVWKPVILSFLIFQVCFTEPVVAQNDLKSASAAMDILASRGEVIIRFRLPAGLTMEEITSLISVDNFRNDTVTAYANRDGFNKFLRLNIPYEIITPPSLPEGFQQESSGKWHATYPSYGEYTTLMNEYALQYPELCRLQEFGTTNNGHKLFALKITDHPEEREAEPVIFYSASMHGDEPAGYVLMLKLVDSLLTGYQNRDIRDLIDHAEIWINPLANPDGAYFLSDSSLAGATRFNASGIDLNRDFPVIGETGIDSAGGQPETAAMISFMKQIRPVLSANFHSGAEVVNYPWDAWQSKPADDSWYRHISHAYADTAQKYSEPGYMTFLNDGITRGIEWYQVFGGRQDYVNFYLSGREVTIELSDNKMPSAAELEQLWNFNKRSLLQYLEHAFTGFSGMITDSATGKPLQGRVRLLNYDFDNSFVFSRTDDGSYFRLLKPGNYNAVFTSTGYKYKLIPVSVSDNALTTVDVSLSTDFTLALYPNPFSDYFFLNIPYSGYTLYVFVIDMLGRKVKVVSKFIRNSGQQKIDLGALSTGYYIIHVVYNSQSWSLSGIRRNP